jgi:hypothetical protein
VETFARASGRRGEVVERMCWWAGRRRCVRSLTRDWPSSRAVAVDLSEFDRGPCMQLNVLADTTGRGACHGKAARSHCEIQLTTIGCPHHIVSVAWQCGNCRQTPLGSSISSPLMCYCRMQWHKCNSLYRPRSSTILPVYMHYHFSPCERSRSSMAGVGEMRQDSIGFVSFG